MLEVIGKFEFERHAGELQIPLEEQDTLLANYKVAIRNYTSRRFLDINSGIRADEQDPKHLKAVSLLLEALDSLDTYEGEYVVRWSNLSEELKEKVKVPGTVIFEKCFTSTSANPNFKHDKPMEFQLIIKHLNGKYVATLSEKPHEEEVLIPALSFFLVTGYEEDSKTIFLEQVDKSVLEVDTDGRGGEA